MRAPATEGEGPAMLCMRHPRQGAESWEHVIVSRARVERTVLQQRAESLLLQCPLVARAQVAGGAADSHLLKPVLKFIGGNLPIIEEVHLLELQGLIEALIEGREEHLEVAQIAMEADHRTELVEGQRARLVGIQCLESIADTAKLPDAPHLEIHQHLVRPRVEFGEGDVAAEVLVQRQPCFGDISPEMDALGRMRELMPTAAVGVVLVDELAPSPEEVPILARQLMQQLVGSIPVGFRRQPGWRGPPLDEAQVLCHDIFFALVVQPVCKELRVSVEAKSLQMAYELSMADLALVRMIYGRPQRDGRLRAVVGVGPDLEAGEHLRTARVQLLDIRAATAVRV
mmetsp:Transcript_128579/g.274230  ORF Transcript_128579/g.274230 Transcript_128579/m.274230 type:complete len:342 (+) Transcript_128579:410-1435(+)